MVMTNAAGAARDVHASAVERAWQEAHARLSEDPASRGPEVSFEVSYAQGLTDACGVLQRHLRMLR